MLHRESLLPPFLILIMAKPLCVNGRSDSRRGNETNVAARLARNSLRDHSVGLGDVFTGADLTKDLETIQADRLSEGMISCENDSRYYSIDGRCNNLQQPLLGAAFQPYIRELPAEYSDGKTTPRVYSRGTRVPLPSSRLVSTLCLRSVREETDRELSANHSQMLTFMGEIVVHDLIATSALEARNCCKRMDPDGFTQDTFSKRGCFPIPVMDGDRSFNSCLPFTRSAFEMDENGVAQQVNTVTSFLDASSVYGSDEDFTLSLRTGVNGTLRLDLGGMLPLDGTQKCRLHPPLPRCPVAGDNRVNVFPGMTAMHLLWHREHNRLADMLRARHGDWQDERLFQEARRILIAEMQHVVYGEYLPIILGPWVMKFFSLNQPTRYNPRLNPSIINSFATAALRHGHSGINNAYTLQAGHSALRAKALFFRPDLIYTRGEETLVNVLEAALSNRGQQIDDSFAEEVTDSVFSGVDSPGATSDLPARNIQRGRDHGLPPYYQFLDLALQAFGNSSYVSEIRVPSCIPGLYRSFLDVDLYLGGISEQPVFGGVTGPTFAYLMGKQFQNIRKADRLFFDTQYSSAGFTKDQVENIKQMSLAGIICRNTALTKIQRSALYVPHRLRNPKVDCSSVPDLDPLLW